MRRYLMKFLWDAIKLIAFGVERYLQYWNKKLIIHSKWMLNDEDTVKCRTLWIPVMHFSKYWQSVNMVTKHVRIAEREQWTCIQWHVVTEFFELTYSAFTYIENQWPLRQMKRSRVRNFFSLSCKFIWFFI